MGSVTSKLRSLLLKCLALGIVAVLVYVLWEECYWSLTASAATVAIAVAAIAVAIRSEGLWLCRLFGIPAVATGLLVT